MRRQMVTTMYNNQNYISYSSVISAAFAFNFIQMCLLMNSFAALNREEIGVEDPSRHVLLVPGLALLLYRCSTLISIGCPGIIWSLKTSGVLCQCTTAHELCSKGKTFFYLTFFTVSYDLEKILTYSARVLNFKEFKYRC